MISQNKTRHRKLKTEQNEQPGVNAGTPKRESCFLIHKWHSLQFENLFIQVDIRVTCEPATAI